jgi:acetyl esterase/lipase
MKLATLLLAAGVLVPAVHAQQDDSIAATMNDLQVRVQRDIAYGKHRLQRMDVYLPGQAQGPILLMVHGGAWAYGDKREGAMIVPKVRHWTARGFVVVSVNYRLLPEAHPLEQARDVARALAFVQKNAANWGADPRRVLLMGHSAGAHLVALLDADPALAREEGAQPWRGTVSLDSAAMDVGVLVRVQKVPLYERAFGNDPAFWQAASPTLRLTAEAPPLLAICSTRRRLSCAQARELAPRPAALGRRFQVIDSIL